MTWTYISSNYDEGDAGNVVSVLYGQLIIVAVPYVASYLTPGTGITITDGGFTTYHPINTSCPSYSGMAAQMWWGVATSDNEELAIGFTSTGNVATSSIVAIFSGSTNNPLDSYGLGSVVGTAQPAANASVVTTIPGDLLVTFYFQNFTTLFSPYWTESGLYPGFTLIVQQSLFAMDYNASGVAIGTHNAQVTAQTSTKAGTIMAAFTPYQPQWMMGILE